MNNFNSSRLPKKLAEEYHKLVKVKQPLAVFLFLRKYFKYIEEADSTSKHGFLRENDPSDSIEETVEVVGFERTMVSFLKGVLKERTSIYKSDALVYIGIAYEIGALNLQQTPNLAFDHYNCASRFSNALATFRLGQCYEKGIGTVIRMNKAITFYRIAAKQGSIEGLHTYGAILINGFCDLPKDPEKGIFYLHLASKKACPIYPYPLFDLAKCYEYGDGADKDGDYALELFLEGAKLGCPNCQYKAANLLHERQEYEESIKWHITASKQGHVDAQITLSNYYYHGSQPYIERDWTLAYYWMLRAATKDNYTAAFFLAEYIECGVGVKADITHALFWYRVAAGQKHSQAALKVSEINRSLRQHEIQIEKNWWRWIFG